MSPNDMRINVWTVIKIFKRIRKKRVLSENAMKPVLSIAAEHLRVLAAVYKMQFRSSQPSR